MKQVKPAAENWLAGTRGFLDNEGIPVFDGDALEILLEATIKSAIKASEDKSDRPLPDFRAVNS